MLQKSKGYKKGSRKVSRSFRRRRKKKCQYIHEQLKTFVSIKKKKLVEFGKYCFKMWKNFLQKLRHTNCL